MKGALGGILKEGRPEFESGLLWKSVGWADDDPALIQH